MVEKRASSGGGAGEYRVTPQFNSAARTPFKLSPQQSSSQQKNQVVPEADRKPLGISSGSIEPKKPIISSGSIDPVPAESERMTVALSQLVHLSNILGVEIPSNPSIYTVQSALASQKYTEASQMEIAGEQFGFSELTDEALLMADEMMKKQYALPEKISERTVRLAHQRIKVLEEYAETTLFGLGESQYGPGYLDKEVFLPGASAHTVQPLDANNVSWTSPLLPALPFGPLTEGSMSNNAFIFAFGFAMIFIVMYIARRTQNFIGSTRKGFSTTQIQSDSQHIQMPDNNEAEVENDEDSKLTWREKMIKMLTIVGQLKRKGKFDMNSDYMNQRRRGSINKAKPAADLAKNAISETNEVDPNLLMFGNLDGKQKASASTPLDDINGNQESASSSNVGSYTPTEFPLEAKLMQPSYALEPASPSSEIEAMAPSSTTSVYQLSPHQHQQQQHDSQQ